MKTLTASSPRFSCRLVRGWIATFGETTAGEPTGLGAGHVAACDDCRRFFGACDELELALRREAPRHRKTAPGGLEQWIIRAVHLATPDAHPVLRLARYVPLALAGAVTCAAVALLIIRQQPAPADATVADNATVATGRVWTSLQPSANALLAADPLQKEVDAVVSDARTAVRFLELNFLPSPPAEPARGE